MYYLIGSIWRISGYLAWISSMVSASSALASMCAVRRRTSHCDAWCLPNPTQCQVARLALRASPSRCAVTTSARGKRIATRNGSANKAWTRGISLRSSGWRVGATSIPSTRLLGPKQGVMPFLGESVLTARVCVSLLLALALFLRIARLCKRFIDAGRALYLFQRGFDVKIEPFIEASVTKENRCLTAQARPR